MEPIEVKEVKEIGGKTAVTIRQRSFKQNIP